MLPSIHSDGGSGTVGVVTACFNQNAFIGCAMRSVVDQTHQGWIHVVVDDGSTDGSAETAQAHIVDPTRQLVVRQRNRGTTAARIAGVDALPPVDFYAFLDADDELDPAHLDTLVGHLKENPPHGVAVSSWVLIDFNGRELDDKPPPRWAPRRRGVQALPSSHLETPFVSIYCWAPLIEPAAVLRSSVYEALGGWDLAMPEHGQSVWLFGRAVLAGHPVAYLDIGTYRYRVGSGQAAAAEIAGIGRETVRMAFLNFARTLSPCERAEVAAAESFRLKRLEPRLGLAAAQSQWRSGHPIASARSVVGAARLGLLARLQSPDEDPVTW